MGTTYIVRLGLVGAARNSGSQVQASLALRRSDSFNGLPAHSLKLSVCEKLSLNFKRRSENWPAPRELEEL